MNETFPSPAAAASARQLLYVSDQPPVTAADYELFASYPDLLSPAHLSEITGQCEATMRAMCAKGSLPAVKVGKRWYVPKPVMVEFVMGVRHGS